VLAANRAHRGRDRIRETSLDMIAGKDAAGSFPSAPSAPPIFRAVRDLRIFAGHSECRCLALHRATGRRSGTALRGYDLDIAIMGRPPVIPHERASDRRSSPCHQSRRPGIAWRGKPSLPLECPCRRNFPDARPDAGTRGLMEATVRDRRHRPKSGMAMSSNETIKQAVIAGLGIAFISAHTGRNRTRLKRRLVTLDVEAFRWSGNGSCLPARTRCFLPPAQAMLDFLSAKGSSISAAHPWQTPADAFIGTRQGHE